ncbi:dTDP-4-dehydrorhamnose reductase [bacterium]|nr:dTDP-4-dehydrorhamnose reductase [candidate division CSSED10-310 bacterium]
MKILVVGSKGMLGHDLVTSLETIGAVTGIDIEECDITSEVRCRQTVERVAPDWIVNAAAYTAVDACETHRDDAMAVNGIGPGNLARAAQRTGARLLHVSTDYVFDGFKTTPYLELDPVSPQTVYGQSKLLGEHHVMEILPEDSLVVRTSWLFGVHGRNFVETIIGLAADGKPLRVVGDQQGSPTYSADLAWAIGRCITSGCRGIVHVANSGATTWYSFAKYVINKIFPGIPVEPVTTEAFPRPARRPLYSVLSTDRLTSILGVSMPGWQNAVDRYLAVKYPGMIEEKTE